MKLKFNGQISKSFNCNKGVPQGLPLSPFLFGVYMSDIFAPRFQYSRGMSRLICSYVDDGIIMVAAPTWKLGTQYLGEMVEECMAVGKLRCVGFEVRKSEWIGFGTGVWPSLKMGEVMVETAGDIRILGYCFNQ